MGLLCSSLVFQRPSLGDSLCRALDCGGAGGVKSDIRSLQMARGSLWLLGHQRTSFSSGPLWQESLGGNCEFSSDPCKTQNVLVDFLVS